MEQYGIIFSSGSGEPLTCEIYDSKELAEEEVTRATRFYNMMNIEDFEIICKPMSELLEILDELGIELQDL
jgi:hypothetical protein